MQAVPSPMSVSSAMDAVLARELEKDRREARRSARLRCRARELRETAEFAAALLQEQAEGAEVREPCTATIELRAVSPLELGLMYAWMAADEAEFSNCADTPDAQRVTCWWSGGATGIQCTWEAATGWFDEELEAPTAAGGSDAPVAAAPWPFPPGAVSSASRGHADAVPSSRLLRRSRST